jgi:NDP-sugar pyrophosphorylase family protein
MVPVAGRPFLEHQIAYLAGQGFQRFFLLTGYLGEQIEAWFADGKRWKVDIRYSREETPLGTGGGLRLAAGQLDERFLLVYGDSFLPEDYRAIAGRFAASPAGGLMVVYEDPRGRTAVRPNVALTRSNQVCRYEKGGAGEDLTHIEAGVVALRLDAVAGLPEGEALALEDTLYPELAAQGKMEAWIAGQPFFDMGTPEGLQRAERYFRGRGRSPEAPGKATGT